MLAKKFRLPIQRRRFDEKNKKAITKKGKFFIAKISPNDLSFSRFGIIISAKAVKGAVKRHQLKRLIFNFIRLNKAEQSGEKDILLIVSPSVNDFGKNQIKDELSLFIKSINQ